MRWYKEVGNGLTPVIDDDKHIINQMLSHGQQLSISEVWYQMTIINIQGNDYGFYVCEGTNKLGSSQYRIQVYGKCLSTYDDVSSVTVLQVLLNCKDGS